MTVHGDGEQSRDFTYVENVVAANLLAAEAPRCRADASSTSRPGGSETVNALADTIGRLLDRPVEKTHGPAQPGDVRESWADVTAARETIGLRDDGDVRGGPAADDRGDERAGGSMR